MKILLYFPLFYETPGDGTGGGGTGAGAGAGTGGDLPGGGGDQTYRLSDDSLIDLGDGKPVKFSQYKSGYVPKADHDTLVTNYNKGREFLMGEAAKLERAWGQLLAKTGQRPGQQGPPTQPGARPDPLANFRNLPIVDGKTLADAYEAMRSGDLQPMQQMLNQQTKIITALAKRLEQVQGSVGTLNEGRETQEHASRVDAALATLGEGFESKNSLLRDIADDVWLSHDPNDPNLAKEFPAMLKARIDGLRKLFREQDKASIEKAKNTRRVFTRPGGTVQPGKPARYQHESGTNLARRLFGETRGQHT